MSTKIFNAYKYNGSLIDLIIELKKVRSKHLEKSKNIVLRTAVELRRGHEHQDNKIKFIKSIIDIVKTSRNSDSYQLNGIDIESSAVIYPLEDRVFLVQFFGLDYTIKIEKPFIDYHYQNQTDQPDDVSDEEWDEREKVWDKIFDVEATPSKVGLIFEICGASQDFDIFNYLLDDLPETKTTTKTVKGEI